MFQFLQNISEEVLDHILDSTIRVEAALAQPLSTGWVYDDSIAPPTFSEKVIEFFTTPSVLAITVLATLLVALASFVMHFIMPVKVSVSVSKAADAADGTITTKARTMHLSAPVEAAPGVILPVKIDGYSKGGDPCLMGADGRHIATIHFPKKYVHRIEALVNGTSRSYFENAVVTDRTVSVNDAVIYVIEYLDDDCLDRSREVSQFLAGRISGCNAEEPPRDSSKDGSPGGEMPPTN